MSLLCQWSGQTAECSPAAWSDETFLEASRTASRELGFSSLSLAIRAFPSSAWLQTGLYLQGFRETLKSSLDDATRVYGESHLPSENKREELQDSLICTAADGTHPGKVHEFKSGHVSDSGFAVGSDMSWIGVATPRK